MVVWADQRGQHAEVDRIAGGEHEAVVAAEPVEQGLLELTVERKGAVHEPAAGEAAAVELDGVDGRSLDPLVAGEAQVVVGPEHDHGPAIVDDRGPRLAGHLLEIGDDAGFDRVEVLVFPRIRALGENVPAHRARRYRLRTVRSMTDPSVPTAVSVRLRGVTSTPVKWCTWAFAFSWGVPVHGMRG